VHTVVNEHNGYHKCYMNEVYVPTLALLINREFTVKIQNDKNCCKSPYQGMYLANCLNY